MATEARVTLRQALPGRVRLSAPLLAWHREACARVAHAIADLEPFARVTVRPATGSVIVEGEGVADEAARLLSRLRELLLDARDDEGRRISALRPEDRPGPTRVARAVAHAVAGINEDVRAALDDRADLGTLLPVLFAAAGVAKVAGTGEMPVPTWFNLLWWSLRSFMTFNLRAVEEEVDEGPLERRMI
jgi:hypothetical protein